MELQAKIINLIEKSYKSIPRNSTKADEYQKIYNEISNIAKELSKECKGEDDRRTIDYLKMQSVRYALTLCHIPNASNGETVLEVGGYGIFSYLLYVIRGYKNIFCIDYLPNYPERGERKLSVLGSEVSIPFININLDEPSDYPAASKDFDKIFFFEVLEHLINPLEVIVFLRGNLKENGRLFLSTPNCCSLLSLQKLFNLFVPMTYNEFNPRRWDTHFREWTPFALKYLLACAGLSEECFDVFYCFAEQASFPKEAFEIYPFPGNTRLNAFLLGDDLFSISIPNNDIPLMRPPLFYNFGEFLSTYYSIFPERKNMGYFLKGIE